MVGTPGLRGTLNKTDKQTSNISDSEGSQVVQQRKCLPYHLESASLNPIDATAIRAQESKVAKLGESTEILSLPC